MDFAVQINNETRIFEQYYDALAYISERLASWNNFTPELEFYVKVTKIPSPTPTLGVSVNEDIDVKVLFGQP